MNSSELYFFIVMALSWLVLVLGNSLIPFYSRKNIAFGVSVPETEYNSNFFVKLRRKYFALSFVLGIILGGISNVAGLLTDSDTWALLNIRTIFIYLFVAIILYFTFHSKVKKYKAHQNWHMEGVSAANLNGKAFGKPLSAWWFLSYLLIIAANAIVTVIKYPSLPNIIPTHYNINGVANKFAAKSYANLLSIPIVQLLMGALFFGIFIAILSAKTQYAGGEISDGLSRGMRFKKIMANFLFFIGIAVLLLFVFIQLSILQIITNTVMFAVPMVFMAGVILVVIILMIKVGQSGIRLKTSGKQIEQNTVDTDENWIGGIIYCNRKDPSLFVEKRFGMGYTLNFGNPKSIFAMAVFVLIIAGIIVIKIVLK